MTMQHACGCGEGSAVAPPPPPFPPTSPFCFSSLSSISPLPLADPPLPPSPLKSLPLPPPPASLSSQKLLLTLLPRPTEPPRSTDRPPVQLFWCVPRRLSFGPSPADRKLPLDLANCSKDGSCDKPCLASSPGLTSRLAEAFAAALSLSAPSNSFAMAV